MTTAVDTVVPVARGQVRAFYTFNLLVLGRTPNRNAWNMLVLKGPLKITIVALTSTELEAYSTVVVEP